MLNPFESPVEMPVAYTAKKEDLEGLRREAVELADNKEIDEMDRVRLTRVLQLVDKYGPELNKEAPPQAVESAKSWLSVLKTMFRFNRVEPKSGEELKPKVAPGRAYLVAEETVAALRDLRHFASQHKETEKSVSVRDLMTQERPKEIKGHETFDTSLTLQYEEKNWGVERVCLDGVQNHLPSDAKGEKIGLGFRIGDEWVSLAQAARQRDKIEAVRFVDDGVGFDMRNLALLYSTKSTEEESRGQFGEGMKMVAAASLRLGLNLEFESQDWSAKPVKKLVELHDLRHGQNKQVEQLSFEADRYEGEPMVGSRTTVWHPTPEFLDEALKLEEKVLDLRQGYKPLFESQHGYIVSREPGSIYAKGIFVQKWSNACFSYNFDDVQTNRDRNEITSHNIRERVIEMWSGVADVRLIKTLLKKAQGKESHEVMEDVYETLKYPLAWKQAFAEAFGPEAVLDTGYALPVGITLPKTVRRISMPRYLTREMLKAGIPCEKGAVPDKYQERLETSLTLKYGEGAWDEKRIFLDAVQNHLPVDSGGDAFHLRFKTKDGRWYGYEKLKNFQDDQIVSLKITDDGRGYDYQNLRFLDSSKMDTDAAGKFGEGMKMVAAAALRAGISVEYGSRDWRAVPAVEKHVVDGREINQLVFDVTRYIREKPPKEDEFYGSGDVVSATTFSDLTPEMIKQFREASKNVIGVDAERPEASTRKGDVMHLNGGMLYVRRLLIPGDHRLMFSYHLPAFDIKSRDRSHVDQGELESAISDVLSEVDNIHIIRTLMLQIKQQMDGGWNPVESMIRFTPKDPEMWKKAFFEAFGENASVMDVTKSNQESVGQANHVGLKVITLPPKAAESLEAIGIPTYEAELNALVENMEDVEKEDLTEAELQMIDRLSFIDDCMPGNRDCDLRIFVAKKEAKETPLGLYRSNGEIISIRRDQLEFFEKAAFVYMHEKTHQITGASDASSGFRDYLTLVAARLSIAQLGGMEFSSTEGSRRLGVSRSKPKIGAVRLP